MYMLINFLFIFFILNNKNYSLSYVEKINLYKQILYPQIKINIKEEFLKNYKINNNEIEGFYFSANENYHLIENLKNYYISNECDLLIGNQYKKSIPIENLQINNLKNHWVHAIKKYNNLNNKHTIDKLDLIDTVEYKLTLTKKELNALNELKNKNNNISCLLYILENLKNISTNIFYVFNPFTGNKILFTELEDILKKQIILYIYNILYKTY